MKEFRGVAAAEANRSLNTEDAWTTLRTMGLGLGMLQMHLKLLNVQPRVDRTLTISGMRAFFEIYNDRDVALASFRPEKTIP